MTATVYNGKGNPSGAQTQNLINHTNNSGGVERVIISYIRTSPSTSQNGYMNISAAMLSHLDNSTQEPSYNLVSMRTNSASSSTFVIEGSKVVSLSYIKKNYIG